MSVRYKRGLQVATDTYKKDGRTVTLVGVSHIADKDFWTIKQAFISAREAAGASIHYELVGHDVEGPQPRALDMKTLAPALGMVFQFEGIEYKKAWTRTDMSWSEMLAHARKNSPKQQSSEQIDNVIQAMTGSARSRRLTRWFISRLLPISARLPLPGPMGIPHSILVGVRNLTASKAALEASGDVVAIWGAAHLPGIGRILRDHGFVRTSRQWSTAISARTK